MALYLSCALCGRKQAHGLLSHARWGSVDYGPASPHRVCPVCQDAHPDWEARVRVVVADEFGGDPDQRWPASTAAEGADTA